MPNAIQYKTQKKTVLFSARSLSARKTERERERAERNWWTYTHRCYKIPFYYYSFCWFFVYKFRLYLLKHIKDSNNMHDRPKPPALFRATREILPAVHSNIMQHNDKRKADKHKKQQWQRRQRYNSLFKAHSTLSLWTLALNTPRRYCTWKRYYYYHHHNQKVIRVHKYIREKCTHAVSKQPKQPRSKHPNLKPKALNKFFENLTEIQRKFHIKI